MFDTKYTDTKMYILFNQLNDGNLIHTMTKFIINYKNDQVQHNRATKYTQQNVILLCNTFEQFILSAKFGIAIVRNVSIILLNSKNTVHADLSFTKPNHY